MFSTVYAATDAPHPGRGHEQAEASSGGERFAEATPRRGDEGGKSLGRKSGSDTPASADNG